MQLVGSDQKAFAQTAIDHDSDDVKSCAAVPLTSSAGEAGSAIHVRLNAAAIADFDIGDAVANCEDFNAQFMAGNSRILEKWEFPKKTAEICAANPHSMRAHQNMTRAGWTGIRDVHVFKTARFFESNGFHERSIFHCDVKWRDSAMKLAALASDGGGL